MMYSRIDLLQGTDHPATGREAFRSFQNPTFTIEFHGPFFRVWKDGQADDLPPADIPLTNVVKAVPIGAVRTAAKKLPKKR